MNYYTFEAGNKEYKLRLSTKAVVDLEKRLGCNPLAIFGNGDTIPTMTQMVAVLHASLTQLQHNITINDAYAVFDDYLADGNAMTDFIAVMLEIYKVSGIIRVEESPKN